MRTNEELEAELEELKKEFYFSSKNGGTGGNKPSDGSQGSSSSDDDAGWTVLYDMYSDDPTTNLNHPTGIHGNEGYIDGLPDLLQFKKIKMRFLTNNATQDYEFIIPENTTFNGMRILQHNGIGNIIITATTSFEVVDGKGVLFIGRVRQITFVANKYPTMTYVDAQEYIRYEKIWAK